MGKVINLLRKNSYQLSNMLSLDLSCISVEDAKLDDPKLFSQIQPKLSECINLQSVKLNGNNFGGFDHGTWSAWINVLKNFKKLRSLNLANINLYSLAPKGNLENDFKNKKIWQELCSLLSSFKDLERLDFDENVLHLLSSEYWDLLGYALTKCTKFQTISFKENSMSLFRESNLSAFFTSLSKSVNLIEINFRANNIGFTSKKSQLELIYLLGMCKSLKTINLADNYLPMAESEVWEELAKVWKGNESLQVLDISKNDFATEGIDRFKALLNAIKECKNLNSLALRSFRLHTFDHERLDMLHEALEQCPNLLELDISDNYFQHWSDSIFNQFKLSELPLNSDARLAILNLELEQRLSKILLPSLQKITIGQRFINAETLPVLFKTLAKMPALRSIDFACIFGIITANGNETLFNSFCETLGKLTSLRTLDFNGCKLNTLTEQQQNALKEALDKLENLEEIHLADNNLHGLDSAALKTLLNNIIGVRPNLLRLNFENNRIKSDNSWDEVYNKINVHKNLQLVDFTGNEIRHSKWKKDFSHNRTNLYFDFSRYMLSGFDHVRSKALNCTEGFFAQMLEKHKLNKDSLGKILPYLNMQEISELRSICKYKFNC